MWEPIDADDAPFWLMVPILAAVAGGIVAIILTGPKSTIVAAMQKALGGSAEVRATILAASPFHVGWIAAKVVFFVVLAYVAVRFLTDYRWLQAIGAALFMFAALAALVLPIRAIARCANT